MSYLLDTHILLWWLSDAPELNSRINKIISDPGNLICVSVASIWEISIKKSIGKLEITNDYVKILTEENLTIIDISLAHINKLNELPEIHKDPFDRILI
jgi:PIN domain nuclease of toxin-antitoxin system